MSNSRDTPAAPVAARALDFLRGRPNPFDGLVRPQRPDDRFLDLHVPSLLRQPRELLLAVIDSYRLAEYRFAADLHETRVVTVLGSRGAGKTHMLEALARRGGDQAQLFVRPTYIATEAAFEDYLLDQIVNTLLGGDPVQGGKPFLDIAAQLTRRLLRQALRGLGPTDRLFAGAPSGWRRLRLLWGGGEALADRFTRLGDDLADPSCLKGLPALAQQYGLAPALLQQLLTAHLQRQEHDDEGPGVIRRELYLAMARATLLRDGAAFGHFLEADYVLGNAKPFFRADRVRQQIHALVEACALVRLPVVIALDNLEGALAPQGQFNVPAARAFLDSVAQVVDATRGLLFLLFAEKELFQQIRRNTHQFALDRIDQGVPLQGRGPVDLVELGPPSFEELRELIAERVGRQLRDGPEAEPLPAGFPFGPAFLEDLAQRRDLGLRNTLLRLREEYARVVHGRSPPVEPPPPPTAPDWNFVLEQQWSNNLTSANSRLQEQSPPLLRGKLHEGLGRMLRQVGPLPLQGRLLADVQPTVSGEEHPTYSLVSLIDWRTAGQEDDAGRCRVMVALLLASGRGMPMDLQVKTIMFQNPALQADHLVVLWRRSPGGDLVDALPSQTRQVWDAAPRRQRAALRPLTDDDLRKLLAFPDWLEAVGAQPEPRVPDDVLRDFVWQRCQSLLMQLLPPSPERVSSDAN
jgi:hypothetical protein